MTINKGVLSRVRLKRRKLEESMLFDREIYVIVSGYGELMAKDLVGRLVNVNSRVVTLQLRDDDGFYIEKYLRTSGVRISDLSDKDSGWRIDINSVMNSLAPKKDHHAEKYVSRNVVLLSRQKYPYKDQIDNVVVEVWEDKDNNAVHYFKAYRTGPVGEGALKSPKELPCFVPFHRLKQVLYDFESVQDNGDD